MIRDERPHNRLKLPFFVACALFGVVMVVLGVAVEDWAQAALGLVVAVGCVPAIRTIRSGRNPWWLRAPLDPKPGRRGSRRR